MLQEKFLHLKPSPHTDNARSH